MPLKNIIKLSILSAAMTISFSSQAQENSMCVLRGSPASDFKYKTIKKLKVAKGTYGGVLDIQPSFAAEAKKAGADAVIDYNASQRFGFWPWSMVRPVITGVAVKWDKTNEKEFSCTESNGFFI